MTDAINGTTFVTNDPDYYDNALSPDALMTYLSTRLEGLDGQIQELFSRQQKADKIRSAINEVRAIINGLPEASDAKKELTTDQKTFEQIVEIIDEKIGPLDPALADQLKEGLARDGYILSSEDTGKSYEDLKAAAVALEQGKRRELYEPQGSKRKDEPEDATYKSGEIKNTREYLDDVVSDLESSSQMNMIHLQSMMSARQTAVSLSTNLISKLSESMQKVVENIR